MSMTKQQKLGVCYGSAFGVVALALGWFLYSAYADHQAALDGDEEEGTKGLVSVKADNERYYTQSNPFPSESAIAAVNSNKVAYAKWNEEAVGLASRGDLPDMPPGLSDTSFKGNYLAVNLGKMQKLPGRVKGKLCADTVWFGFEDYMPPKNETPAKKDIPKLFKQFVTVTNVVDILVKCGALEIKGVKLESKEEEEEETARNAKSKNRKGRSDKDATVSDAPTRYEYNIDFYARAPALVKVLNELAKCPRFYVVSEFGFEHEGESLKDRIDRMAAAAAGDSTSRRSRRRDREDENKEKAEESGDVTNPATDLPILVHMKLAVYDFGKGGARADAGPTESAPAVPEKVGN